MEKYSYSILNDFPNQKINLSKLTYEIQNIIQTELSYINTSEDDDTCDIFFESVLSESGSPIEMEILNNLVAMHDGVAYTESDLPLNPYNGQYWYDSVTKMYYMWDSTRSKWLSVERQYVIFSRYGNADGMYLDIGDVKSSNLGFDLNIPATVLEISVQISSGSSEKEFQIHEDSTSKFSFNLSDKKYNNTNLNVDLASGKTLKIYVSDTGSSVRHVVVYVKLAWRYE